MFIACDRAHEEEWTGLASLPKEAYRRIGSEAGIGCGIFTTGVLIRSYVYLRLSYNNKSDEERQYEQLLIDNRGIDDSQVQNKRNNAEDVIRKRENPARSEGQR
ncbi:hypothetical protein MJO28_003009 [Puccinia striiformis f. sp. tritici]|uniref:Uncharacterized protein n=1 Tax=Puccinia striiformis f. sp. tritici TaxID=168172 RepID=A0ACC0ESM7_9BASI|nr:hypothetical protein MJO28_003009 [Puccinia striiformis f. sp. tritici]